MRLPVCAPIIFLYFFVIKSSICFLGHGNCDTSLTNTNGDCDALEKIKTDSDLVSADNAFKNNVGLSETRVTMSRYHLGTENSRIYKERSSKRNSEHAIREIRGGSNVRFMTTQASRNSERLDARNERDMSRATRDVRIVQQTRREPNTLESRRELAIRNGERNSIRSNRFGNVESSFERTLRNERIEGTIRLESLRKMTPQLDRSAIERRARQLTPADQIIRNRRSAEERRDSSHRISSYRAIDAARRENIIEKSLVPSRSSDRAPERTQTSRRSSERVMLQNDAERSVQQRRDADEALVNRLSRRVGISRRERSVENRIAAARRDNERADHLRANRGRVEYAAQRFITRVTPSDRSSNLRRTSERRDVTYEHRTVRLQQRRDSDRAVENMLAPAERRNEIFSERRIEAARRENGVQRRTLSQLRLDDSRRVQERASRRFSSVMGRNADIIRENNARRLDVRALDERQINVFMPLEQRSSYERAFERRHETTRFDNAVRRVYSDRNSRDQRESRMASNEPRKERRLSAESRDEVRRIRLESIRGDRNINKRTEASSLRRHVEATDMIRAEDLTRARRISERRLDERYALRSLSSTREMRRGRNEEANVVEVSSRNFVRNSVERDTPLIRNDRSTRRREQRMESKNVRRISAEDSERMFANERSSSARLDITRKIRDEVFEERQKTGEYRRRSNDDRVLSRRMESFRRISNEILDHSHNEKSNWRAAGWFDGRVLQLILLSLISMHMTYKALDMKAKMRLKQSFVTSVTAFKEKLL